MLKSIANPMTKTIEKDKSKAGRKALPPEQKVVPRYVYLKKSQWEKLDARAVDADKTVSELITKHFDL